MIGTEAYVAASRVILIPEAQRQKTELADSSDNLLLSDVKSSSSTVLLNAIT